MRNGPGKPGRLPKLISPDAGAAALGPIAAALKGIKMAVRRTPATYASPYYTPWDQRPAQVERQRCRQRNAMRAAGASELELLMTYKMSPERLEKARLLEDGERQKQLAGKAA